MFLPPLVLLYFILLLLFLPVPFLNLISPYFLCSPRRPRCSYCYFVPTSSSVSILDIYSKMGPIFSTVAIIFHVFIPHFGTFPVSVAIFSPSLLFLSWLLFPPSVDMFPSMNSVFSPASLFSSIASFRSENSVSSQLPFLLQLLFSLYVLCHAIVHFLATAAMFLFVTSVPS